jgi:uncharacterized protein YlzI (FlbEa/FlbD family)
MLLIFVILCSGESAFININNIDQITSINESKTFIDMHGTTYCVKESAIEILDKIIVAKWGVNRK